MHAIEAIIADFRARGQPLDLHALGGLEAVVAKTTILSRSPFNPDIVGILISERAIENAHSDELAAQCVIACYAHAPDDLTLLELNDWLGEVMMSSVEVGASVFAALCGRFESKNTPASIRRAALHGALSLALGIRGQELRLAAALLSVDIAGLDSAALAKGIGTIWSRVRDDALEHRLGQLAEAGCGEAMCELGAVKLVSALERLMIPDIVLGLAGARTMFVRACEIGEPRADAHIRVLAIDALLKMLERIPPVDVTTIADKLLRAVFALSATEGREVLHGWRRTHQEELYGWARLALTVDALSRKLWEPSWWQPAAVIGEELLRAYSASKTFFQRASPQGLEAVVRPVISASLFERAGQLHQVKEWLRHNPTSTLAADAAGLISQVDRMGADTLAGRIETTRSTGIHDALVAQLMATFSTDFVLRLPDALTETLEDWLSQIENHADLRQNPTARKLIGQIALLTLTFLLWCTDRAAKRDPLSAYLFEASDKKLPHEKVLQHHYETMLAGWMGPMGVEVRGVSSGRCDVAFSRNSDRFVVEVKRELDDSSSENLFALYGAQTEEYQNSSWRLGLLLVLDLTRTDGTGLHVSDAVASRSELRHGESAPRTVFLVKVAGRRLAPSELTKAARGISGGQ